MTQFDLTEVLRAPDRAERHARLMELAARLPDLLGVADYLLSNGDEEQRLVAVELLGHVNPRDRRATAGAAKLLFHALQQDHPPISAAAAVSLSRLPEVPTLTKLSALRHDPRSGVRLAVTVAMGRHGDAEVTTALADLSRDPELEIRSWAVFALCWFEVPSDQVLNALARCVDDDDPEVRGEAVLGLANAGDERAVPGIEQQLRGEFAGIWPIEAAARMPRPNFRPLLEVQLSQLDEDEARIFGPQFREAIEACSVVGPVDASEGKKNP